MERTDQTNITLEDIEAMISILEKFIRVSRRAEHILRRLAPSRSSGQHDFMQMFMEMALAQKQGFSSAFSQEVEEVELTEEEKALIEKIRQQKTNV